MLPVKRLLIIFLYLHRRISSLIMKREGIYAFQFMMLRISLNDFLKRLA